MEIEFSEGGELLKMAGESVEGAGLKLDMSRVKFGENRPFSGGERVVRHSEDEAGNAVYLEEGYTAEQLADPRILREILAQHPDLSPLDTRMLAQGLTKPITFNPYWEGARTYSQVVAATVGENPRAGDRFKPSPSMMIARQILEPLAEAHPLIIDPEQMNALDAEDWSFIEAHDYGRMAHLPFEPLYLDFGGWEDVMVDTTLGQADVKGALIYRTNAFKGGPSLAVVPFGGWEYLNVTVAKYVQEKHKLSDGEILLLTGGSAWYDGKFDYPDSQGRPVSASTHLPQWKHQHSGMMFFGPEFDFQQAWDTDEAAMMLGSRTVDVERVFALPNGFVDIEEVRNLPAATDLGIAAVTGLRTPPIEERSTPEAVLPVSDRLAMAFEELLRLHAEAIGRMAERALLGLYFIENAPVAINPVPLSRQVRRAMERKGETRVASMVVIPSKVSRSERKKKDEAGQRNYKFRWERTGYFIHYHVNNRHYQLHPELVKPCHKCERAYAENEAARLRGDELPHPNVESPDCIKKFVEPVVCGPEELAVKQKVRVKRKDDDARAA